jgi:cytochrome P450
MHYGKQGIKFTSPFPIPFVGDYLGIGNTIKAHPDKSPLVTYLREKNGPVLDPIVGTMFGNEPILMISDPQMIQDVLTKHKKTFDKSPRTGIIFKHLLNSIIFMEGNELWAKKRKSLSGAFFKSKLINMT